MFLVLIYLLWDGDLLIIYDILNIIKLSYQTKAIVVSRRWWVILPFDLFYYNNTLHTFVLPKLKY